MAKKKSKKAPQTPHEGRNLTDTPESVDETPVETPAETPAAPVETPPARLNWALNGAAWEAVSLAAPGRLYQVRSDELGHCAGYAGQKAGCPAAGAHFALASLAREACQTVEDSIE